MHRFSELAALARARHPKDKYFPGLVESVRESRLARNFAWGYERAFLTLDDDSWAVLRDKALAHFTNHREGMWKQGFFNQLNEAFAYALLRRRDHTGVKVLRESGKTTPDIQYDGRQHCEVKTLNISDAAIERRASRKAFDSVALFGELQPGFLKKFGDALDVASTQIKAAGDGGLVFVMINFDDFTLDFYEQYRRQIVRALAAHPAPNVHVKIGTLERKFVRKGIY